MTRVKSLVLRTCKRLIIILIYKLYHPKYKNITAVLGKSEVSLCPTVNRPLKSA